MRPVSVLFHNPDCILPWAVVTVNDALIQVVHARRSMFAPVLQLGDVEYMVCRDDSPKFYWDINQHAVIPEDDAMVGPNSDWIVISDKAPLPEEVPVESVRMYLDRKGIHWRVVIEGDREDMCTSSIEYKALVDLFMEFK